MGCAMQKLQSVRRYSYGCSRYSRGKVDLQCFWLDCEEMRVESIVVSGAQWHPISPVIAPEVGFTAYMRSLE